jgi:hypothetical protein
MEKAPVVFVRVNGEAPTSASGCVGFVFLIVNVTFRVVSELGTLGK